MSQLFDRKTKIALAWVGVLLAGGVVGGLGVSARRDQMLAELIEDAKRSAVAFDASELRQLKGTRDDVNQPVYLAVKNRLRALQAVNARVRFVYIFRADPQSGKVRYLGDSAAPGAKDESLPGDDYPQAAESPGLQEIIRTGQPSTEGPLSDDFGRWITGYAAIGGGAGTAAPATPADILGLDIDATTWSRELFGAGFRRALYVWLLLGLPLGAWLVLRRQFEQREVIRNLSEAMEQSHSAIMIVDLDSRIEYANRGLCQQIGYGRRELIGRKWRDFQVADTSESVLADLIASVRAGRAWEGEWFNRRKDGTVYPVRGVVTPVKHRDGSLACFVAVFDDVTDIKRREAELREARDRAEAGDRAKGQFLATMSHEVRTPLNGIVGFTSLLLETNLEAEQREYVQTIRASGESLIQLTGDILDFARIESGKLKLDPSACDPRECIEEALDLHAAKAAEKKIELLHRIADNVPAAIVIDGGRLRQVLFNLVSNAVKFTEAGEIEVALALAENSAAGPEAGVTLAFTVRDTGIGISAGQQEKLFKPFSQIDESTTRRYGGTGLGLAICRNLVGLLGGEISCTSEPGRGSTFKFTVRAPVASVAATHRTLGLRLGLAAEPGALRREIVELARSWQSPLVEADTPEELAGKEWDIALVDVTDAVAHWLACQTSPPPGLTPARTFGLVSISLPSAQRQALRPHFRLLINKPVHHESLFAILSGADPGAAKAFSAPMRFGLRVLLVEDNPVNQRLMQRVLASLGCTWVVADNGRVAIEELSARAADYDIVLLDLHMPEMDGISALQAIRAGKAGPRARSIWIAVLTADVRDDQRARAQAEGVNDYLTKPLKLPELEAALRRFCIARAPNQR